MKKLALLLVLFVSNFVANAAIDSIGIEIQKIIFYIKLRKARAYMLLQENIIPALLLFKRQII